MKKIWIKSAFLAVMGLSATSCGDFLDIYPLTMVYEDNYWTEKNDVDQFLAGCYTRMQDEDFMKRLFVWGEVRSDNVGAGDYSDYSSTSSEGYLLSENLLSTNAYTDWSPFYSVIDRCNQIIERAPQVAEVDPSYLESDVNAAIAEATALRALCYFYLVRTFKDVPYYTYAITDDEAELSLPATDGDEIVQNLINDLVTVCPNALRVWPRQSGEDVSYGRITQYAIYAMLADMCLWLERYSEAAYYAQLVIDYKTQYFEENYSSSYNVDDYPLVPDGGGTIVARGTAFNLHFGTGGGPESIFELYFSSSTSDNTKSNTMVPAFYYRYMAESGVAADYGYFAPTSDLKNSMNSSSGLWETSGGTDSRRWESIWVDDVDNVGYSHMVKYSYRSISLDSSNDLDGDDATYGRGTPKNDANWIFYRVSEMMLIRAEALIYQVSESGNTVSDVALAKEAYALIRAVANRSASNLEASNLPESGAGYYSETDTLVYQSSLIELVYDERRREFLFEGKRWYDLVRRSRHDGNTNALVTAISGKFSSSTSTSKFGNLDAIYWPYNYDELSVNENLTQNSAYPESSDSYESTR